MSVKRRLKDIKREFKYVALRIVCALRGHQFVQTTSKLPIVFCTRCNWFGGYACESAEEELEKL